jgi:leucyl aminopeptidase
MSEKLSVRFAGLDHAPERTLALFATDGPAWGKAAAGLDKASGGALAKAAEAAGFKGSKRSQIELLAPPGISSTRIVALGLGKLAELSEEEWVKAGGSIAAALTARLTSSASLFADIEDAGGRDSADIAADLAMGAVLRTYDFDKYRTRKRTENGQEEGGGLRSLIVHVTHPAKAEAAYLSRGAIADGVWLARDLVNEPANELGPVEFAERARELEKAGLEVEILDEAEIAKLKMGALLGVAQGSQRPARVAILQWHGASGKRTKPLCFVGKGVVFDTGGISMKPAAGMEDMKGDMGGAAAVSGLMLALARRKAKVNAIGLIGLVENMPSGNAQRPGDIVRSMSGQTIEVLNTDAEGRLVLADVMWYAQERFKPRFIVNLATLTGAIMVALGKEHAGLFSNDDKLAAQITKAGTEVGEAVWRMPLGKAYDKLLDSKNADMKNIGPRWGGAVTAAQFIQRFVKTGMPWAHLDVAGTAMDSNRNEISQTWASGWGVRLLDRLVAENYE